MAKIITVSNVKSCTETGENEDRRLQQFEMEGGEDMEASDGYHTFDELYEHRIALFITLARLQRRNELMIGQMAQPYVWRSKLHSDGTMFEGGWFILGIGYFKGQQMTYHLPISKWEETNFAETLERAPEWDGHSPANVLERLKNV